MTAPQPPAAPSWFTRQQEVAFVRGFNARVACMASDACPYTKRVMRYAWTHGYDQARLAIEQDTEGSSDGIV